MSTGGGNTADDAVHRRIVTGEADFLVRDSVGKCATSYVEYVDALMNDTDISKADDAFEKLIVNLGQYESEIEKVLKMLQRYDQETEYYNEQSEKIKNKIEETRQHNQELRVQLEQAQRERLFKYDYESMAEKIQSYPTREELQKQYDDEQSRLQHLENEKHRIDHALEERRRQFSLFMTSLTELRNLLKPQNAASAEVVGEMGTAENSAEYQEQQAVEEDVKME